MWLCELIVLGSLVVSAKAEPAGNPVGHFGFALLSPDGGALAYAPTDSAGGDRPTLQVMDLATGATVSLPDELRVDQRAEPAWSPDGSRLAYLAYSADGPYALRILNRATGRLDVVAGAAPCGPSHVRYHGCHRLGPLQWSPDGGTVYFLGVRADEYRFTSPEEKLADLHEQRGVSRQVTDSIEVRSSSYAAASAVPALEAAADLLSYDVERRALAPLSTNGHLRDFFLSPAGDRILAIASGSHERETAKQVYRDFFLVSTGPENSIRGMHPLLRSVKQWGALASWSPRGDQVAYIEQGALTDGDVFVVDVVNGKTTLLTVGKQFGNTSDVDVDTQARDAAYPGSKFGSSEQAPIWSHDGQQLLISRRAREKDGWRTSLWALDIASRAARPIASIPGCDLISATFGRQSPRALFHCRDESVAKGYAVSLEGAPPMELAGAPTGERPALVDAAHAAGIVFVSETPTEPPEVHLFDPGAGKIRALTRVNESRKSSPIRVEPVRWTGARGIPLSGALFHTQGYGGAKAPLIVEIYPRHSYLPMRTFLGFPDPEVQLRTPLPELLRAGVAIFKPQIPVAGGGKTCDELAENLTSALAEIKRLGLADIDTAGIYGHSFGGWAVNCVVTRTSAFKAGVSVAGASDLISDHFGRVNRGWAREGGQIAIRAKLQEAPLLYWRESPISGLANVSTPLLLIHGRQDLTVGFEQSSEMFEGLSDLGKEAQIVIYENADHNNVEQHPDYSPRIKGWFAQYLGLRTSAPP